MEVMETGIRRSNPLAVSNVTSLSPASTMSHLFPPNRSLLYPQFETYRLHPLDPQEDVTAYALPGQGATQSRIGYNTHLLSFKETRARISWDHLSTQGKRGVYVDAEWNVIGFELNVSIDIGGGMERGVDGRYRMNSNRLL